MTRIYLIAADGIAVVHLAYVLVVVLGLPAIWAGWLCRQKWTRNVWLRYGHLTMILIVVLEAWAGIICPLTTWEQQLRMAAGQEPMSGGFIANLVHNVLFYDLPPWVFTLIYTVFGGLVLGTTLLIPPTRLKIAPSRS